MSRRAFQQNHRLFMVIAVTCIAIFCVAEVAYASTLLLRSTNDGKALQSPPVEHKLFTIGSRDSYLKQDQNKESSHTEHRRERAPTLASHSAEQAALALQITVNNAAESSVQKLDRDDEDAPYDDLNLPASSE